MDTKYSREAFEDFPGLADALSEDLTARLRTSARPVREVETIITELRALGHELCNFDESHESAFWGGDYVAQPYRSRLVIAFWYPESGPIVVSVGFRRWSEV